MQRIAFFSYGVLCHLLFLGVYVWFALFVANSLVPKARGSPAGTLPLGAALAIDIGLLALFGLQHSVMARPAFKRVWTRYIPQPIERSTYVLASCIALIVLMLLWQPLGMIVW